MDTYTVLMVINIYMIIHILCALYIIFLANINGHKFDKFENILIWVMAPEILLLFIILKIFK